MKNLIIMVCVLILVGACEYYSARDGWSESWVDQDYAVNAVERTIEYETRIIKSIHSDFEIMSLRVKSKERLFVVCWRIKEQWSNRCWCSN